MEPTSEDSNSSVGSYHGHNSPLNYSKQACQLSSKATAFSIDALIGKRTLAKMQAHPRNYTSGHSSDEHEDCLSPKGTLCESPPPAKKSRQNVPLAPLGRILGYIFYIFILTLFSQYVSKFMYMHISIVFIYLSTNLYNHLSIYIYF